MDAEDARAVLGDPQVELAAGLGAAELRTLDVENQGLPREILARDGERTRHSTRVRSPRGEDAVRRRSQHREPTPPRGDRKSTRLNSSHGYISYAVFCLKKKITNETTSPS